jgi:endonuclease/exonuclease/phosphatase family metal-dependent hydrolase
MVMVKFATYNIQYGVGQDGRYDLTRTIAELQNQDVICLQEVTTHWSTCNRDVQPDMLAKALNLYAVYAPAWEVDDSRCSPDGVITNARRGFGNMVLSRWPIVYSRPHSLERPRTEVPADFHPNTDFPRTALEVVIDIDGTALRIFSVHLSHLPGIQQEFQIEMLKQLVCSLPQEAPMWEEDPRLFQFTQDQPAPNVPRSSLLLGDFNFEPDSALYAAMLDPLPGEISGLVDGWTASGNDGAGEQTCIENDGRLSRLDYMFASDDLRSNIQSARVNQNTRASDHFPLYFKVEI